MHSNWISTRSLIRTCGDREMIYKWGIKVFAPKRFLLLRNFSFASLCKEEHNLQYHRRRFTQIERVDKRDCSRYSASTIMHPHCKEFSFDKYDAIGFDLDGTLLRYNLYEMVKLEYNLMCRFLVEQKNYSGELLNKTLNYDFLQKGLIIDADKGNILKLSANASILRATHGTTPLSMEQIIETYGPGRQWAISNQFLADPLSTWNGPMSEKIRALLDYFDIPVSLVFAQAVDLLDSEAKAKGSPRPSPYKVWPDILDALIQIYTRENFANGKSGYFEALRAHPEQYLLRTNERVIQLLKDLRATGKPIYLLTGSNADFANFTASYALGANWRELFDCIVFFARKPGFFVLDRPFLRVDGLKELPGSEISLTENLKLNEQYMQGNWPQLRNTFANKVGKDPSKMSSLYIGDNLIQDVYTPVRHHDYEAIAVSEEMLVEESKFEANYEYHNVLASSIWGSFFCIDNESTLWGSIIAKYSQMCIATIDSVAVKTPAKHIFHCENADGYYPKEAKVHES